VIFGQKTLTGRIFNEDLEALPEAKIYDQDTTLLGVTDNNGYFEINITIETKKILVSWIGYELTTITISDTCQHIDVILIVDAIYDIKSHRKIDRLRKREYDKLPSLYKMAYNKGLFISETPCYKRDFKPYKPQLDKIRVQLKEKRKLIKEYFKKLAIGDTIRIPFSGTRGYDGTERTTLSVYSYVVDRNTFDCIIKGVVLNKNRKGYKIVYRVINCEKCNYTSIVYNGKDLVIGEVLEHYMKYFKIIIE
jgi:sulfur relay (sulfurtransferase) DsrF/TusC family protein